MIRRAVGKPRNRCSFRHSSRKRPLKLSTKPFCMRLAGRDVVPGDAGVLLPAQDGVRGQLGAVVADDHAAARRAARTMAVELARDPAAGERGVDDQRQALPGEVVDDHQHAEAAAVGQHVGDEVEAPALVRCPAATPSAPACRAPACGRRAGAPSAAPRDRAGTASCGSARCPRAAAGSAGADSRTAGARRPAHAAAGGARRRPAARRCDSDRSSARCRPAAQARRCE